MQAVTNDEEYAERIAALQEEARDGQPWSPPMSTFSPEVEALSAVVDAVRGMTAVLIKANGGGDSKFDPYPRPRTAIDRIKATRKYRKHQSLAARLLQRGPSA